MHALVQAVSYFVAALAISAFAHFGVTLKHGAAPPPVVQRIPVSSTAQIQLIERRPCPLAKDAASA